MRRVLFTVLALVVFMGIGTAGASASAKGSPAKGSGCDNSRASKSGSSDCAKPKRCKTGLLKKGKCASKPAPKPTPKPRPCKEDEYAGKDGTCHPKPPLPAPCGKDEIYIDGHCVPRPTSGPCAKADLVLLEDLLKGTGALACVYLFENAPNADDGPGGDCPDALLALPIDSLLGACVYLPPADVGASAGPIVAAPVTGVTQLTGHDKIVATSWLESLLDSLLGGRIK